MSEPNQNETNANEQQVFDDSVFDKPQEVAEEVAENAPAPEAAAQEPVGVQDFLNQATTPVQNAYGQPMYDVYGQPVQNPNQYAYGQHAYQIPNPNVQYGYAAPAPGYASVPSAAAPKSKVAAGVLGILLGSLGIHKFYLGYTVPGVIMLLVTILTLGLAGLVTEVIGLVEGIIYLTMSDADFYNTYVVRKKEWF